MNTSVSKTRDFLGTGIKFPLQIDRYGNLAMSSHEQSIEESLYTILSTAKRERVMIPDFGCGMHEIVFTPNTPSARSALASAVRQCIVKYEPRIDILDISIESPEPHIVLIKIGYRVRANNAINNLVYPFFINEGK